MCINARSFFKHVYADIAAASLEFLGTTLFLLLGLGGIQSAAFSYGSTTPAKDDALNTVASIDQLLYISASMGLSLLVSAWLFFRVTGGLFNPNVSLSLLLVGAIKPFRFILYCIAQLVGSILAVAILRALLPGPLVISTSPSPGVSNAQAVIIEMILTAALVMAVLMLAAEKHRSTAFAPIGIGLTLFAGHLWGVAYTGASMNSARSFGPDVILGFTDTQWIYWAGPFAGSLLAVVVYAGLKHFNYHRLNPEQDTEDSKFSPNDPVRSLSFRRTTPGSRVRRRTVVTDTVGVTTTITIDPVSSGTSAEGNSSHARASAVTLSSPALPIPIGKASEQSPV